MNCYFQNYYLHTHIFFPQRVDNPQIRSYFLRSSCLYLIITNSQTERFCAQNSYLFTGQHQNIHKKNILWIFIHDCDYCMVKDRLIILSLLHFPLALYHRRYSKSTKPEHHYVDMCIFPVDLIISFFYPFFARPSCYNYPNRISSYFQSPGVKS